MLWAGWALLSRRAEVTHDDISYSFSGSCWCSHFLSQDLHVSQGAVDSSVDMDRLNRNMPECARQTRQVLQVSVFRLGMGEGGESVRKRGPEALLFPSGSQYMAEKRCQIFLLCHFPEWTQSLTVSGLILWQLHPLMLNVTTVVAWAVFYHQSSP